MNSSLQKALTASMLAVGGSVAAIGQVVTNPTPGGLNWDRHCIDPNLTSSPYSTDFGVFRLQTPLWEGAAGISGTCTYKVCTGLTPNGGGVPVAGRIGFANGPIGSIQDDFRLQEGDAVVDPDNGATFNYAMNVGGVDAEGMYGFCPSGSGFSFADVVTDAKQTFFGSGGFYEFFQGASNRYFYMRTLEGNTDVLLVMDVIGDASRCTWELTNEDTTKSHNLGLYFSQWVWIDGGYPGDPKGNGFNYEGLETLPFPPFQGDDGPEYTDYVGAPGMSWTLPPPLSDQKFNQIPYAAIPGNVPIELESRYKNTNTDPSQRVPAYITFTGGAYPGFGQTQSATDPLSSPLIGPGFEVVNAPIPDVEDANGQSDQTPVDEFVIGDPFNTLAGYGDSVGSPTVKDLLVPDTVPPVMTYTQKWYQAAVGPGQTRTIVSYYRSTWGDSDYSNGYTVVVDTPKIISVNRTNPTQFDFPPQAVTTNGVPFLPIRVNVDNTGAFGSVYKAVQMSNVRVTLQLGRGLYDANNPGNQTLTNYIPSISPVQLASTDFEITADPTVQGPVSYTVTVTPDVGAQKTITGFINLGATAQLLINQGPNLVTAPWTINNPTWQTILGLNPETDFQAFTWDSTRGEYVIQTGPQRGFGTWIVSNSNFGFLPLQGNPQTPADEFPPSTGLGTIALQQGWNLVANPYNYSFPLGQLIGVAQGGSTVFNYDELVQQGFFDGSFAFYDSVQQSYNFIESDTARMLPNYGYWVYAQTPMTIQFPPIYDIFVRKAETPAPFKQRYNNWRLQLQASQGKVADQINYAGVTTIGASNTLAVRKAPIPPVKGAIRAYLTNVGSANRGSGTGINVAGGAQYQQLMHNMLGKQQYNFSVYTSAAGATTVTWPNLKQVPDNLSVTVTDSTTNRSVNARSQTGMSFNAAANSVHNFMVTVTPEGTEREAIGSVSTPIRSVGAIKQMTIGFDATTRGAANLYVYKGSRKVGTIIADMDIAAGQNVVKWSLLLSNGQVAPPGEYTLAIQATGEGGDTTTKLVNVRI